jgi:hypothetical protein
MLKMQVRLCAAAGCKVRNMQPLDVYLLAGKILNDGYLTKLANDNSASREFVMRELMTDAQLETLRSRISA